MRKQVAIISGLTLLCGVSSQANITLPPPSSPPPSYHHPTESDVEKETIVKRGETINNVFQQFIGPQSKSEEAADFFTNPALHVHYDYSDVRDNIIGNGGHSHTSSFSLTGSIGDDSIIALTYTRDRYNLLSATAGNSYLQDTDVYSLFWGYNLDENWTIGTYASYSQIDAEAGANTGSVDRLGAGLLLAYNTDLNDSVNLGLYTSVSSLNKRSIERLFNDEDSLSISGVDINIKLSDELSINPYASITAFLDKENGDPDGHYGNLGADVNWTPNDHWELSVGYSSLIEDNSRDEDTITGRVSYSF